LLQVFFIFIFKIIVEIGAFKPPFGGIKNYPITIRKLENTEQLPLAHTWF